MAEDLVLCADQVGDNSITLNYDALLDRVKIEDASDRRAEFGNEADFNQVDLQAGAASTIRIKNEDASADSAEFGKQGANIGSSAASIGHGNVPRCEWCGEELHVGTASCCSDGGKRLCLDCCTGSEPRCPECEARMIRGDPASCVGKMNDECEDAAKAASDAKDLSAGENVCTLAFAPCPPSLARPPLCLSLFVQRFAEIGHSHDWNGDRPNACCLCKACRSQ